MQLSNYPSHNQFQPAMNKWWKLNDVLLRVNKFCVNLERNLWKIDWNIALTYIWGKHNVKPLDRLFRFLLLNISTINSTCSYISMHHLINWSMVMKIKTGCKPIRNKDMFRLYYSYSDYVCFPSSKNALPFSLPQYFFQFLCQTCSHYMVMVDVHQAVFLVILYLCHVKNKTCRSTHMTNFAVFLKNRVTQVWTLRKELVPIFCLPNRPIMPFDKTATQSGAETQYMVLSTSLTISFTQVLKCFFFCLRLFTVKSPALWKNQIERSCELT